LGACHELMVCRCRAPRRARAAPTAAAPSSRPSPARHRSLRHTLTPYLGLQRQSRSCPLESQGQARVADWWLVPHLAVRGPPHGPQAPACATHHRAVLARGFPGRAVHLRPPTSALIQSVAHVVSLSIESLRRSNTLSTKRSLRRQRTPGLRIGLVQNVWGSSMWGTYMYR
jgi:hypothetical protein